MHFHSLDYLLFLALAVVVYWPLRQRPAARLLAVLCFSCAFYMAWSPHYIALILGSAVLDYTVGLRMGAARTQGGKRALLLVSLCGNLGLLGTFKYFNFFNQAAADVAGIAGVHFTPAHLDVLLPVGISFYTFQTLSYTIDVYRGRLEPTRSFLQFACFVTFFPQLVAGPIVRASELLPQLARSPRLQPEAVSRGLFLIATGLVKKVAFADYVAVNLVDRVFDDPAAYSAAEVMLALYGYTLQIYCDFSGYTDVARGSAALFGLSLPENFDRPYQATSPADFWRRWHMTLSSWLRDYLYFPLGGSRAAPLRAHWNLWLTLFLIGLWHGASWNFVIYGSLQATVVVAHRIARKRNPPSPQEPLPTRVWKILLTLHFVVLSRIFFRAADFDNAMDVWEHLAGGGLSFGHVTPSVWFVLLFGMAAHYTPRAWFEGIGARFVALPAPAQGVALAALGGGLMQVVSRGVVPYIYFQF